VISYTFAKPSQNDVDFWGGGGFKLVLADSDGSRRGTKEFMRRLDSQDVGGVSGMRECSVLSLNMTQRGRFFLSRLASVSQISAAGRGGGEPVRLVREMGG
jgi:hypothetical protein